MAVIPFHEDFLPEKDGHRVYFAQYGNPKGEAIVSLHGGPGSKSKPKHVARYDLTRFQAITIDQRGCGKSEPLGELRENTTQKLIEDIERLRTYLGVEQWFVSGGSWGATLALIYAEAHPERVRGLLLGGIFLAFRDDEEWAFSKSGGVERLFPDVWEKRMEFLRKFRATPENAAEVLLGKMLSGGETAAKEIAAGVHNWEANLFSPANEMTYLTAEDIDEEKIASAKIFLHFEANNYFLEKEQILRDIGRIRSIPTVIVHGRYDVLCPLKNVWMLKKNLQNVNMFILPSSGHGFSAEGDMVREIVFNNALTEWTRKD
ncbi:MAG: prolyl aminopeptidase [Parcubacteria group bacterium]|nr:prolyl aminopeptidase [Parcubacteria group bacterium]